MHHRGAKLTFSQSEEDERLDGGSDADGGGGGRPGGAQPRGQHVGSGRQKAEGARLAGAAALGGDDEDLLLDGSAEDGGVGGGHGHGGQDEDGLGISERNFQTQSKRELWWKVLDVAQH